jgi:hypothetical protein
MALKVIDRAIQVHGGAGVSDDTPLAAMYAHMRTLRLADLHVAVAPLLHALVEVDEQLAEDRRLGVAPVDVDEQGLDGLLVGPFGHEVPARPEVGEQGVEDVGGGHRRLDPRALGRPLGVGPDHPGVAAAEHGLDLAELRRLEARGGVEAVAEGEEARRRERLEHVDLRDDGLEDGQDAAQRPHGAGRVARGQDGAQPAQLVEELLEPQLVDLVDDDEQELVVLLGAGDLARQELIEAQVARVRDRRRVAHAPTVAPRGRLSGRRRPRRPRPRAGPRGR